VHSKAESKAGAVIKAPWGLFYNDVLFLRFVQLIVGYLRGFDSILLNLYPTHPDSLQLHPENNFLTPQEYAAGKRGQGKRRGKVEDFFTMFYSPLAGTEVTPSRAIALLGILEWCYVYMVKSGTVYVNDEQLEVMREEQHSPQQNNNNNNSPRHDLLYVPHSPRHQHVPRSHAPTISALSSL
jgi:hypothetical protein